MVFILFLFSNNTKTGPYSNPSPTAIPTIRPVVPTPTQEEAVGTFVKPSGSDAVEIDKNRLKGDLINILPYSGKYFTLDYDFGNYVFILRLDKNNLPLANQEIDAFLKQHGIESRSWLDNLQVQEY